MILRLLKLQRNGIEDDRSLNRRLSFKLKTTDTVQFFSPTVYRFKSHLKLHRLHVNVILCTCADKQQAFLKLKMNMKSQRGSTAFETVGLRQSDNNTHEKQFKLQSRVNYLH